ncbi:DUF5694 domain-containing protein [Aurantiacibacter poecillastricola]|uniref:DUF5694 domain-containing protein n=1 Tax=Aurantiacibacter poecillastricola TaxID=3064385 RepID=UPI00273FD0D6|nr:DUF5694 domain-containing protein [Aurantiacibacter sp. 219JJ12-13]MDP5261681.1 DUF5694 domain-containing protein [Aurantiacibacter sp. 219JJ12-13]
MFNYEEFARPQLDSVLAALERWKPAAIGIERVPGREIEDLSRRPSYAQVPQLSGEVVELAQDTQAELGIDLEDALAQIAAWSASDNVDPLEARRRIGIALAAYEPETALLYWWQLNSEAKEALPAGVAALLRNLDESSNERVQLAARLAARLGLPRLWSIDSQRDKDLFASVLPQLQAGIGASDEASNLQDQPWFVESEEALQNGMARGDLLSAYRFYNGPDYEAAQMVGQFDLLNRVPIEADAGRVRQAAWDMRNLGIAAQIRRASASVPGERVLVVIGAGHKPFLDRLLPETLDLRMAQPIDFLTD